MCGIAGLYDPRHASGPDKLTRRVAGMAEHLTHRGPDDRGTWAEPDGAVALGHRRLAVVQLGAGGHQPMVSADGRWVATYNGEIYNLAGLRRRLESDGVPFRAASDTEVLLASVQEWGLEAALDSWEGMFALGLWDRRLRQLHLVRDRFGEKPLYYGWIDGQLAFASELKALRGLAGFTPRLEDGALALFLRHSCVPAPLTIYAGVSKLAPGEMVTAGPQLRSGQAPARRTYWSAARAVEDARRRPLAGPEGAWVDELETTLSGAVGRRLVADVPIGAFLSGGVDSSVIVALMQQHASRPVRTFTVGFEDPAFDESGDAAAVAVHLGTDHTALRVTDAMAAEVIGDLPTIWDEPFADISQIPTLLVSRLARQHVTVALSGDGGDELFAGYNRHAWLDRIWRRSALWPAPLRRAAGSTLLRVPPTVIDGVSAVAGSLTPRLVVRNPSTKVAKVAKVLAAAGPGEAYQALVSHWEDGTALAPGGAPASSTAGPGGPPLSGITEQMLWLDLVGYLPDDILTKLDRAAMAASLETRVPFLDRRVLDLAWRLPMAAKLHGGSTKWVLRQVLYRHVPRPLVERPKMGFGLPIGAWLRGSLRHWAEDLLAERRLTHQGLLDPEPVRRAWRLHLSGRRDLGYELWDVLSLQSWLDRWLPGLGH